MSDTLHVFVDTNVWLAFYHYTSDDAEQLAIIAKLIEKQTLKLYITGQVRDEFFRNREKKLADAIKVFAKSDVSRSLPRCMTDYEEAAQFRQSLKEFEEARSALVEKARLEADKKELRADKTFAEILGAAPAIDADDAHYLRAMKRRNVGNPPGKSDSVGDQLSWEILLSNVPNATDLHIVSNDGDFESDLIPGKAHQFLIDEWAEGNGGTLHLHSELRPFLNANFPDIKLAVDIEKADYILGLKASETFSATHFWTAKLLPLIDLLTWENANELIDAMLENSQIRWIGTDQDVSALYTGILQRFDEKIDEGRKAAVVAYLTPDPPANPFDDSDEPPPF